MRPPHDRSDLRHDLDDEDEDELEDPEIDPGQEELIQDTHDDAPEAPMPAHHHPQLQIRRDLHAPPPHPKPSTITSSVEPSFLGSFRKRALGADRPLPAPDGRRTPTLSLRMHHQPPSHLPAQFMPQTVLMPPSTGLKPPDLPPPPQSRHPMPGPSKIVMDASGPSTSGMASDLSMKKNEAPPPRPPQNPPKKTGFTIEDIMRR